MLLPVAWGSFSIICEGYGPLASTNYLPDHCKFDNWKTGSTSSQIVGECNIYQNIVGMVMFGVLEK